MRFRLEVMIKFLPLPLIVRLADEILHGTRFVCIRIYRVCHRTGS